MYSRGDNEFKTRLIFPNVESRAEVVHVCGEDSSLGRSFSFKRNCLHRCHGNTNESSVAMTGGKMETSRFFHFGPISTFYAADFYCRQICPRVRVIRYSDISAQILCAHNSINTGPFPDP